MKTSLSEAASTHLTVPAETTADLMMRDPKSIREDATVQDAIALLTTKGLTAISVIDDAGQPVGVVSRTDILVYNREAASSLVSAEPALAPRAGPGNGVPFEKREPVQVRDIMTPVVFAVAPDTSLLKVAEEMLALKVQQLFVVDHDGVLVGIISALDVLKHLCGQARKLGHERGTGFAAT